MVWTPIGAGGMGKLANVIPPMTIVRIKAVITNLFCFSIWDIEDHFMEFDVVNEATEFRDGFMPDINIFQSGIV
jgi:hypothetical protein